MFKSPKVPVYVVEAGLAGDAENKLVRFTFYITPIKHALAAEISPDLAKQLFHPDASGAMHYTTVMPTAKFNLGTIDLQRMFMYPTDDPLYEKDGVMLDRAKISNVGCRILFPEKPEHTLEFRVEVPGNKVSAEMMWKYFKQPLFITFEPMQKDLPTGHCSWCEDDAVANAGEKFACQKHVKKLTGTVVWIKKEAEAAAEA